MKTSENTSDKQSKGIAGLFDESERKDIFRKYLIFLGWIEVLIFIACWLYQLGNQGYDRYGPIEIPFPWKVYFLIAFLAPVAVTFLLGMVIVGFNKYFGEPSSEGKPSEIAFEADPSGRLYKLNAWVKWLQHIPFLGLLLLLGIAVGFFYNLDTILGFIASVGQQSVKIFLIALAVLTALASVFALILIVLNYRLRKTSMEYRYKSEVAERFGLIILDDNTVLNSEGRLLVSGKKWKDALPLLPEKTTETLEDQKEESRTPASTPMPRTADAEVV